MKAWDKQEKIRYNEIYRAKKHYGVSEFDDYAKLFPEIDDREKTVIDIGCGAAHLSSQYDRYYGIDISEEIIARNQAERPGTYAVGSLQNLEWVKGRTFDILYCNDVMEHVPMQMTGLALQQISKIDARVVYFKIHKGKANFKHRGEQIHRTIEDHGWWGDLISNFFYIEKHYSKGLLSYFKCVKKKNVK
jgi:2-polyprenyl-3-methyl-5-hydroxy-6-metoxy-1,4-benzoquinol methylase